MAFVVRLASRSGGRRSRQLDRAVVTEHHLFPRLIAPPHGRGRIRVEAIGGRVDRATEIAPKPKLANPGSKPRILVIAIEVNQKLSEGL